MTLVAVALLLLPSARGPDLAARGVAMDLKNHHHHHHHHDCRRIQTTKITVLINTDTNGFTEPLQVDATLSGITPITQDKA